MNEYLVEDEYSFYEIDPECKIGILKDQRRNEGIGKTEQKVEIETEKKSRTKRRRNSRQRCLDCSCLLLYSILFNGIISPNLQRRPDKKR